MRVVGPRSADPIKSGSRPIMSPNRTLQLAFGDGTLCIEYPFGEPYMHHDSRVADSPSSVRQSLRSAERETLAQDEARFRTKFLRTSRFIRWPLDRLLTKRNCNELTPGQLLKQALYVGRLGTDGWFEIPIRLCPPGRETVVHPLM
jgi:hypothetical protein